MSLEKTNVLLVTTSKGYWASKECDDLFPRKIFTKMLFKKKHSTHWSNSISLLIETLWVLLLKRPKIIFVGAAVQVGLWLEEFKRIGLLKSKLLVHNRHYHRINARGIDAVIHDSTYEVDYFAAHDKETKHFFVPYCMDYQHWLREEPSLPNGLPERYVLTTGSAGRNYEALLEVSKELNIPFVATAQVRDNVKVPEPYDGIFKVYTNLPEAQFYGVLRNSEFVVVALEKNDLHMGGGSTVLKSLQFGKPVITEPYHRDYVVDGQCGYLIDTSNVSELKMSILNLWHDRKTLELHSRNAKKVGITFDYNRFSNGLSSVLEELMVT